MDEYHKIATFIPIFGLFSSKRPAIMLFKHAGTPRTWEDETKVFPEDMRVCLNASGSVDSEFMLNEFIPWWISLAEAGRTKPRVLLIDHHPAHFTDAVNEAFIQEKTIVARIPKSLRCILQPLDVYFFAQHRNCDIESLASVVDQVTTVTCALKRNVTCNVARHALDKVKCDVKNAFRKLGITSQDNLNLRGLPDEVKVDLGWEPPAATKNAIETLLDRIRVKYFGPRTRTE